MDSHAAALIVHDIKNALGVLEGELQCLSAEPERERATLAWQTCSALREKMIGFLTLYKASAQGLHAHVEALNPEDFLNAVVTENLHRRADVEIMVDTANMPPLAFFDEHLVGLALQAALQNASRFARSRIVLSCSVLESNAVAFFVRDDGPGPSAAAAEADPAPSTGLGMALCAAIAAAHVKGDKAGSCFLSSRPGGGAIFELRLP